MKRFIHLLSALVRRFPLGVLIGAVLLTLVFGSFIRDQQTASGNEGFSPDSEEFAASNTIEEVFPETTAPVQVVFKSSIDDVLTIRTTLTRLTMAKIEHEYQVLRNDETLATARVTLALVDRTGTVQQVPDWVREIY